MTAPSFREFVLVSDASDVPCGFKIEKEGITVIYSVESIMDVAMLGKVRSRACTGCDGGDECT